MKRRYFPVLARSVLFVAALAVVALGPNVRRSLFAASPANATPGPSGYHLLKKITLGGDGGWDVLRFDSPTRRLFISRQTKVIVLNVDSEKVVGEIPNTDGVHDIALAPEFNRGFTSNGRAGTVTIFDLKTLAVIGSAPVRRESRCHGVRPCFEARLRDEWPQFGHDRR